MLRRTISMYIAALAALAALSACSPTIRIPKLQGPGTAPVQRNIAEQFDPYPLNDMGPEIVGGRPIDFAVPRNEVTRANQFRSQNQASPVPIIVPQTPAFVPAPPPPASSPTPSLYRY